MTERNYYIALLLPSSAMWAGEFTDEGHHPTNADSPEFAKAFTLEEAEAYVAKYYEKEGWIKWAIYKMELISSYRDSSLERLAKAAE